MQGSTKYTVFISYSHSSERHKAWVRELAERLVADGIHVVLDEWDLKPGQNKYVFMEKMVTDRDVMKVLAICDKLYQEKADGRLGGVGTESQLISKEVYEKVDQTKFIPIVVELTEAGEPCLPTYMASLIYFDMVDQAKFEGEYQRLVRDLYGKPERVRPPLGEPPAYITEEAGSLPRAASILKAAQATPGLEVAATPFIAEFFNQFLADLEDFRFAPVDGEPYDETMAKLIERMRPLRDSFISFASTLARLDLGDDDLDLVHDYLERVARLQFRPRDVQQFRETDWDNYRFICYETMLYFMAILTRYGKYNYAARIADSTYFYDSNTGRPRHATVALFNKYVVTLEEVRKNRLQLRRVSIVADTIKTRAEGSGTAFDDLVAADLLLHYITLLNLRCDSAMWHANIWFPHLSVYASEFESIPILQRLISRRHFDRVKMLLGVNSADDLRKKIEESQDKAAEYYRGGNTFHFSIRNLASAVPVDDLATLA